MGGFLGSIKCDGELDGMVDGDEVPLVGTSDDGSPVGPELGASLGTSVGACVGVAVVGNSVGSPV